MPRTSSAEPAHLAFAVGAASPLSPYRTTSSHGNRAVRQGLRPAVQDPLATSSPRVRTPRRRSEGRSPFASSRRRVTTWPRSERSRPSLGRAHPRRGPALGRLSLRRRSDPTRPYVTSSPQCGCQAAGPQVVVRQAPGAKADLYTWEDARTWPYSSSPMGDITKLSFAPATRPQGGQSVSSHLRARAAKGRGKTGFGRRL